MPNPISFTVADLSTVLSWQPPIGGVRLPPAYQAFQSSGAGDIRLELSTEIPQGEEGPMTFDSGPMWSLHRVPGGMSFRIYDGYPSLKRRLFIHREGGRARLTFLSEDSDPFLGPSLELLIITHLARVEGVILHACGVNCGGRGVVFAGESGAGKSTLSRLWAAEPQVEILSDDRVIVRRQNGSFRLYGTPWHGDEAFAAPGGVKLERIFFIRHGARHRVRDLRPGHAVREMLKCSFPPFWDAGGTAAALDLFAGLAAAVPCAELSFSPERGVIDFIRSTYEYP